MPCQDCIGRWTSVGMRKEEKQALADEILALLGSKVERVWERYEILSLAQKPLKQIKDAWDNLVANSF